MKVLSSKGLEKISELQDKYRFQNTFVITEPEEVIDFLTSLHHAYYNGLDVDHDDMHWIDEALEVLTS